MIGETRFSRRIVVACAYAVFLCVLVLRAITGTPLAFGDLGFVFLLFVLMVGHRRIAGRVRRKQQPYLPSFDERDIAMRDHASYITLNIVAWYTLLLCVLSGVITRFPSHYKISDITYYALLFLLAIAFTLPSAIVLWVESDLTKEEDS